MSLVLQEQFAQILLELLFDMIFCSHKLRVTNFFRIARLIFIYAQKS
jgi:hypothetical protein